MDRVYKGWNPYMERHLAIFVNCWLFGLCYAMDRVYKGWNPYIERHLAIFVNYF
jgi:hypothetical protein